MRRRGSAAQQLSYSILGPTNDCLLALHDHRPLQELLVVNQNVDDGLWVVDEIIRVQFELLELAVLANKIFDGIFENGDQVFQLCSVRWSVDV